VNKVDAKAALSIAELRTQVDIIDLQLLESIKKRATLARQMGVIKKDAGAPLRDTARESTILEKIIQENRCSEPRLPDSDLENLYRCLMQICLKIQESENASFNG